jgi:hypothetical protein
MNYTREEIETMLVKAREIEWSHAQQYSGYIAAYLKRYDSLKRPSAKAKAWEVVEQCAYHLRLDIDEFARRGGSKDQDST